MGVHDGHRARLKDRFLSQGLEGFEEHNVLELLLFYSIPRMDTNEIAHNLLDKFGSISAVFDASAEELCSVKGISMHTATLIKLIPELFSLYHTDKTRSIQTITSTEEAGRFFIPRFYGKSVEEVYLLLLDDKRKILKCEKISEGIVNLSKISVKKIVSLAINCNATGAILAHNHPAGLALPSREDRLTTQKVFYALETVNVRLCDHIIVADNDYVSLADSGEFRRFDY
ncbi:MAG: RadC family protein [Oscillospiraceae bacterium]|nr:RadC family protein [Oscillospiraceae bacterium]